MSDQIIKSDLFVELSTEEQQLLAGGYPGYGYHHHHHYHRRYRYYPHRHSRRYY
jgi:hypothetical protein